jgi:hypothetical protein
MEIDNITMTLAGSQQIYFPCAVNLSTYNFDGKFLSCLSVCALAAN